MTCEDVKAQLAKCPLEWEEWTCVHGLFAKEVDLNDWVSVFYNIARGELYIEAHYVDDRIYGDPIHVSEDIDELKAKAEDHRIDLICRMLGIKD